MNHPMHMTSISRACLTEPIASHAPGRETLPALAVEELHPSSTPFHRKLTQKRRRWTTAAQILFPVFFFAILALLRAAVKSQSGPAGLSIVGIVGSHLEGYCSQPVSPEDFYRPLMDSASSFSNGLTGFTSCCRVWIYQVLSKSCLSLRGPQSGIQCHCLHPKHPRR
jgi:hypothetical protein